MSTREEWVRVESETELAPGMFVEHRQCSVCDTTHRYILIACLGRQLTTSLIVPMGTVFRVAPVSNCTRGRDRRAFLAAILRRRLYRLAPDAEPAAETTATGREIERVR